MIMFIASLVLCVCAFGAVVETQLIAAASHNDAFYWRDYTGVIPEDALPAGIDVNGHSVYIGQVSARPRQTEPAKIYINDRNAYYEFNNRERSMKENIKIFCTPHPERFEWITVSYDSIGLLINKQLVIGGYQQQYDTYIGRVREGSEISVGKALRHQNPRRSGLFVTKNGRGARHTSFEILSYNPNVEPSTSALPIMDIRFQPQWSNNEDTKEPQWSADK